MLTSAPPTPPEPEGLPGYFRLSTVGPSSFEAGGKRVSETSMMEVAPNGSARTNASPAFEPAAAAATEEGERNPIFDSLVGSDGEIAGLVAYSIYKQNKRAWLDDFIKVTKRTPTEAETRSYIIGESTERRLATYRQLAAATLGGQSVRLKGSSVARSGRLAGPLWALVALAALAVVGLALRFAGR